MILDPVKVRDMYLTNREATDSQREGLLDLLMFISNDISISIPQQAAYMMATVKHECAKTWKPIQEYGHGVEKAYGETYYGRGYVQLTWKSNYEKMGKYLGEDLLKDPDLALKPEVAYSIMTIGMRFGLFTGKKLTDYITAESSDYINARRIINGTDCAELIAGYADEWEKLLR